MGPLSWIAGWLGNIVSTLDCIWGKVVCSFFNLFFDLLDGLVTVLITAIAWVPIPSALSSFTWPDAGPLGGILIECGMVQAMSILAAAFSVRFLKGLIPFIRA